MTTTRSTEEQCGESYYWWNGEAEGCCELPKNHLHPFHFDGINYFDDDNNDRRYQQECLQKLISQVQAEADTAARIDEAKWVECPSCCQLLVE